MKIAVISDIHGNFVALQEVLQDLEQWQPDQVIVNGDTVNRGPRSLDCLNVVLEKQATDGWRLVRGNHEDYIIDCGQNDIPVTDPDYEIRRFAYWAYRQLGRQSLHLLDMPSVASVFAPDGTELRAVHAAMHDNRDGIYPGTEVEHIREQIAPAPTVFATAHTHRSLIREVDETLIVNTGSVGSSFDGDRRSCYGRFTWCKQSGWQAELRRVSYDWKAMERDYVESGFLAEAGPLAQLMLVELRRAGGLVYRWAKRYYDLVQGGEMTMEESVRLVLQDEDLRPFTGPPGWDFRNCADDTIKYDV